MSVLYFVIGGDFGVGVGKEEREGVSTNQYQRSTWSVCSLFRLSSMAFRIYSGSLENMRVPSARPLSANLVARKTLIVPSASFSLSLSNLKNKDSVVWCVPDHASQSS